MFDYDYKMVKRDIEPNMVMITGLSKVNAVWIFKHCLETDECVLVVLLETSDSRVFSSGCLAHVTFSGISCCTAPLVASLCVSRVRKLFEIFFFLSFLSTDQEGSGVGNQNLNLI